MLGLIREVIFASLFGASKNMDAFLTAFRAPNMLRDLFAEGALSTAFVTTFSGRIATEGDQSAWQLASKVATLTVIFMSALTLLGVIFAPALITVLAPGFAPDKAELTILLTRIMFPFILLVSLAALVMGMLNAKNVFGMPAMASSFFNLGSIIGGVGFGWLLDPHFGSRALIGLVVRHAGRRIVAIACPVAVARARRFPFQADFDWRDPGVRKVICLMVPATIAASAVQVNVAVNSGFASGLGDGPMSWLNIAFRLMQLPLGLFGVAIATVTLPLVSRSAALGNTAEFRGAIAHSLRLVMLLTIPSAIGLIILAEPIISLIYQHGRFTAESMRQTAAALRFYAIGLAAYSGVKVLAPAFYAVGKKQLPMLVSLLSIAVNFGLNWFFRFQLGLGSSRSRAFHQSGGDHKFPASLYDDAAACGSPRNRRADRHPGQSWWLPALRLAASVCLARSGYFFQSLQEFANLAKGDRVTVTVAVGGRCFSVRLTCCTWRNCAMWCCWSGASSAARIVLTRSHRVSLACHPELARDVRGTSMPSGDS